jgi:hypothetical protein
MNFTVRFKGALVVVAPLVTGAAVVFGFVLGTLVPHAARSIITHSTPNAAKHLFIPHRCRVIFRLFLKTHHFLFLFLA